MRKRYHCPKHVESTPSAVVYRDGWYCFGCGQRGAISELGLVEEEIPRIEYVEDLQDTLRYIERLPKRFVRGFELPHSLTGYYLVYPCGTYYKHRIMGTTTPGGKYRGPSGHKKPPYVIPGKENSDTLVLVEGEFNAMTLALLDLPIRIISPGGAGDFYSKGREKDLITYSKYYTVIVVVDDDAAGAQAAIETKSRLLIANKNCDVRIKLLKEDFNDVYVNGGRKALEELATSLGLPERMPNDKQTV